MPARLGASRSGESTERMKKKSYYVREQQLTDLRLLSSLLPGHPDEASLVRDGIDLILEKCFALDVVKQAMAERAKKEERLRLLKPREGS